MVWRFRFQNWSVCGWQEGQELRWGLFGGRCDRVAAAWLTDWFSITAEDEEMPGSPGSGSST